MALILVYLLDAARLALIVLTGTSTDNERGATLITLLAVATLIAFLIFTFRRSATRGEAEVLLDGNIMEVAYRNGTKCRIALLDIESVHSFAGSVQVHRQDGTTIHVGKAWPRAARDSLQKLLVASIQTAQAPERLPNGQDS